MLDSYWIFIENMIFCSKNSSERGCFSLIKLHVGATMNIKYLI